MDGKRMRCAHCGSDAVVRLGRDRFRCEHCGTEGGKVRRARPEGS